MDEGVPFFLFKITFKGGRKGGPEMGKGKRIG